MKTGIVDVGGGMRGIYAAGVLDWCMDHGITFDVGVGVSAGSANLASFTAKQPRRNFRFYSEYALRKEYMSWGNFLRKRSYIDLDYVYGVLSNSDGENPLDYVTLQASPAEILTVATEASTGKARYFPKSELKQDAYHIFKASSAIPTVCKPYLVDGTAYFDGALADPVPIQQAFNLGCEKVVLLLTLPEDTVRTPDTDQKLARGIRRKYPAAAKLLEQRAQHYNDGVALARRYAGLGKLLIVAPDDTCGVRTLTRDADALSRLYEKGYQDGQKIADFLK